MSGITTWLTSLSIAILSVVLAIVGVEFAGMSVEFGLITGALFFLSSLHISTLLTRARERRVLDNEISYLQRGHRILTEELAAVRNDLDRLAETFERKTQERSAQVIAEVRLLETLIRQLADEMEKKAREAAVSAIEKSYLSNAGGNDANSVRSMLDTLEASLTNKELPETAQTTRALQEQSRAYGETLSEGELLQIIRSCLEENRVDLYLQPIVTLPQRRVKFYEGLSRLRAPGGEVILPAQYLRVAEPAGLMSVIDNLLLFRCVQIVRRLVQLNKNVGIVCNISRNSLVDRDFFPQFLEFMSFNVDLAPHLVFEFGQETIDACEALEWSSLAHLADMGFRFSMDRVTDLDIDLPDLRQRSNERI